jgi:hypothetical protein
MLIEFCLKEDPAQRPTAHKLMRWTIKQFRYTKAQLPEKQKFLEGPFVQVADSEAAVARYY